MLRKEKGSAIRVNIITANEGKAREFIELGKVYGIEVNIVRIPKVEIQSEKLEEIAMYSAINAVIHIRDYVVVEDAGLFIEALNGFPGPYSSYVYKKLGIEGVLKLMDGVSDRRAYFKSVIAFASPTGLVKIFEGVVHGEIALSARGSGGFGFDPIFIPKGERRTFAEMSVSEKNKYSHRARAFKELANWLRTAFKASDIHR
ncbi:MAG: XTP/dITP diphosphatase [Desulfurococcales archaeon]|nr:XTP/dITP diphosphatase [Desulfurococcales archaeon]